MDRSLQPNSNYRADIDGLRAIAVISVMLYHFELPWLSLSGGFSGVDVFFVISGYLITQILVRERHRPYFLLNFAKRRIRRIFPALMVMLGVCLAVGYVLLVPHDYENLAVQSRYATFALSNFYFLNNTEYFDTAAELLPLLHTWSLAVEEQFYLFWPAIILLGHRMGRKPLMFITIAIVVASLIYSQLTTQWNPKLAFYSPLSRAWELGLGALLVFVPVLDLKMLPANLMKTAGLMLIAVSFVFLDDQSAFPGFNALFACVGSALILAPIAQPSRVCRTLSLAPFTAVGLISYSLYLWHWPVIVFFQHFNNSAQVALPTGIALIGLSFLLAFLSWKFVELPFRSGLLPHPVPLAAGFGSTLAIMVSALLITQHDGVSERLPAQAHVLKDPIRAWQWEPNREFDPGLPYSLGFGTDWEKARSRVIIWGDSHAEHLAPVLESTFSTDNRDLSVMLYSGCPSIVDGESVTVPKKGDKYNDRCQQMRTRMLQFLSVPENKPDLIILAAAWYHLSLSVHKPGYSDTIKLMQDELAAITGLLEPFTPRVAIIAQVPPWRANPIPCEIAKISSIPRINCDTYSEITNPEYRRTNRFLAALSHDRLQVIVPANLMCVGNKCLTHIDGEFLYRDIDHLRRDLPPAVLNQIAQKLQFDRLLEDLTPSPTPSYTTGAG